MLILIKITNHPLKINLKFSAILYKVSVNGYKLDAIVKMLYIKGARLVIDVVGNPLFKTSDVWFQTTDQQLFKFAQNIAYVFLSSCKLLDASSFMTQIWQYDFFMSLVWEKLEKKWFLKI